MLYKTKFYWMTMSQFSIFLAMNKCYLIFSVYSDSQYRFQISFGAFPQTNASPSTQTKQMLCCK